MESTVKSKRLRIGGMTCVNCQDRIEKKLRNTAGIKNAKVSYSGETADITYDTDIVSLRDIGMVIEKLGYQVLTENEQPEPNTRRIIGILIIIVSLYVLLQRFGILNLLVPNQLADTTMGYGMLFIIGLITSVHCVAMCGGINLSQCIPHDAESDQIRGECKQKGRFSTLVPAFLYNLGRVISYTAIGFALGFVGLLFGGGGSGAGLPVMAQGILKLIAGVFMVIMGINMLGIFPGLRNLQPKMPRFFSRKINADKARSKSPLIVGLLNGLMPCGPLQSMQIVALASENPIAGALSMLLFSLGTVPLMLGLGSIASALGRNFTHKVMRVGAVLVVVLGLAMLSQGGSLSGLLPPDLLFAGILGLCAVGIVSCIPFRKPSRKTVSTVAVSVVAVVTITVWSVGAAGSSAANDGNINVVDGKQVVNSTLSSGSYPNITVQVGTPVKWIIDAPEGSINGCNYKINIQEYGITNYAFQTGENVIEFTPTATGKFQYSCWMGMIRGTITVTEAAGASDKTSADGSSARAGTDTGDTAGPTPAGYKIPTEDVAIAKETTYDGYPVQEVTIKLTDKGFSPAVIIIKSGLDVLWHINDASSSAEAGTQLLIPNYGVQFPLGKGDNPLAFYPADSFDFSTEDNAFYGYVKVVDDLNTADVAEIKAEVRNFQTMIWPKETFQTNAAETNGAESQAAEATVRDGVQYVTSTVSSGSYEPIRVQQGIPVKWTLNAPNGSLNGCNNSIVIPEYNLQIDLKTGENLIEFTPDQSGTFVFSCWMGMVRSSITVVSEDGTVAPTQDDGSAQLPSCCGGY